LRGVLAFAALYVLAWSALPPWLESSFPLDVVESLTWGREWQWGYYKHPPLSPWLLHLAYRAFGGFGPFLLSQACIGATLWLVWLTGRRLMDGERAFIGTVLTMGVAFYTRPALEFNHNIAQMPLWAALGWSFLAALQDGRLRQWALVGLLAGIGMLTKYSVAIVLVCLGLYLLATPARRLLRTPGPWLALALAVLVMAPHLLWLWQADWLPMAYARGRSAAAGNPRLGALAFLGTQALNHLPMAIVVLVAIGRARRTLPAGAWGLHTGWRGYLLTVALAPGLLVTALGVVAGMRIRDMWGVPMWAFSGLLVAALLPGAWLPLLRPRVLRGLGVWLVLITALSLAWLSWGAQLRHRPARTDWPQPALVRAADDTWQRLSHCPLDTVAGNYWLSGLVAVPLPSRPSVLITGDPRYSPWVSRARLQERGALWVREASEPDQPPVPLDRVQAGQALQQHEGTWTLDWPFAGAAAPLVVHWRAYVPPRCARQAAP